MIRFAGIALAVLAICLAPLVGRAAAENDFCMEDPVFIVNGNALDVTVGFSQADLRSINGAIFFELDVPSDVVAVSAGAGIQAAQRTQINRTLAPWNHLGVMTVVVRVTIPSTRPFPMQVYVTGTVDHPGRYTYDGQAGTSTEVALQYLMP